MRRTSRFSSSAILVGAASHSRLAAWALILVATLLVASPAWAVGVAKSSPAVPESPTNAREKASAPVAVLAKCTGLEACAGINPNLVGDGSCNGDYSCYVATGPIGAGSCNGTRSCYATTYPVGDSACNGLRACYRAATGLLTVASNSCNGDFACEETHGTVGAGSCSGLYSCFRAGGSIGTGSCNAYAACESTANSVGNYSCNGELACFHFAAGAIGNCQFNAVLPAQCGFTIGGNLSGLASGAEVVLRNNGGNDLTLSANGAFVFSTPVGDQGAYVVTVFTQPTNPNQLCSVSNGSGTVAGASVANVGVSCVTTPNTYTVTPSASAGGGIAPATAQTVTQGQTTSFTVSASPGFYLGSVSGSCGGSLVGSVYTTAPVIADCNVAATFLAKTVSASALSASVNPVRGDQPVVFQVTVSGSSAPNDGQVQVTASTGESCSDSTPPQISGNSAIFDCPITFTTLGPRSLSASFSGSTTHLDSASAALNLSVSRFADLSVTISDGQGTVSPGQLMSYLIAVRNAGPDHAPGSLLVLSSTPTLLNTDWSCTPVGPATCPAATGSGELGGVISLPAGAGLDFIQNGNAATPAPASLSVSVNLSGSAVAPNFVFDPQSGNNQASDVNVAGTIFGSGFEN